MFTIKLSIPAWSIGIFLLILTPVYIIAQPKVGINTTNPQATLEVGGDLKLGDASNTPQAGMIRWNAGTGDFEGYTGTKWLSLTKSNSSGGQWGQISVKDINENFKLTSSDGSAFDQFGFSVCVDGNYAIVGAYGDDAGLISEQGSAYIFVYDGSVWNQQAKLTASDGAANDRFGFSVSIHGTYAIVGAYLDDNGSSTDQGSAYIFERNGSIWTQQAKLIASDGATNDQFGASVSINGDYAIVGSKLDDNISILNQGSAYIFFRTGSSWSQQAKLTASDGAAEDLFGNAVSINGDYAIVGANSDDDGVNSNEGSAYIFVRSGTNWTQQFKLNALDGKAGDLFGFSVCINGNYAIVGSLADNGTKQDQGAAYIYNRVGTSWTQQAKLTASDGAELDQFGYSVGINGDYAIVGAFSADNTFSNQGSAYIFLRNGLEWKQQTKMTASDGSTNDFFGISVSIGSDFGIVGAYNDDVRTNTDQGSVYIIQKN